MNSYNVIHLNNKVSIKKFENSYKYSICFGNSNSNSNSNSKLNCFAQSILQSNILPSSRINISDFKCSIDFYAENVCTFKDYLKKYGNGVNNSISYDQSVKIIYNIGTLISSLENNGYTFYALDVDNIIVIDDSCFLYLGVEYLIPIFYSNININSNSKQISFLTPFDKSKGIFSPEVLAINSIPSNVTYKSIYYSLAFFIMTYLFPSSITLVMDVNIDINIVVDSVHEVDKKIMDVLKPIMQTKLYWFLIKNLSLNSENRCLILI